jgi:hypothetical protein
MSTPQCGYRLIVLAAIAWEWVAGIAWAQTQTPDQRSTTPPSLAVVKARVPVGGVVYVTDTSGATMKGKLAALTDDAVQVNVGDHMRGVPAAEIRRIQWQQRDSPLTGVLIGAAVGAVPGLYWLAVDPNECTGMCPEEYALIAIGAVVGGVIDLAMKTRLTVYAAEESSGRANSIAIGPILTRDRQGLRVAVRF